VTKTQFYEFSVTKPSLLERFGLYYLNFFKKIDSDHSVFDLTDAELTKRVNKITFIGILLSCIVGAVCVFPTVWVDIHFADASLVVHYGWVGIVSVISIIIELYILFIIAIHAVYRVSELINLRASDDELVKGGLFNVQNILARTALELPDPEIKIMGIDPFKRISKTNILLLGLLYKAKILVSNIVIKYTLIFLGYKFLFGVSTLYAAIIVECFWNSVVIKKVIEDARLRLFGFALANQIGKNIITDKMIEKLSPMAKKNCLRAIGNAVVMAQNYHPNMVILFIRFQEILQIEEVDKYDDWNLFIEALQKVTPEERFFLLDLFTVSAAFDGKLSDLEKENLKAAYSNDHDIYFNRLTKLTDHLKNGKLNAALVECKLDFEVG
jgi:hypothetical protein